MVLSSHTITDVVWVLKLNLRCFATWIMLFFCCCWLDRFCQESLYGAEDMWCLYGCWFIVCLVQSWCKSSWHSHSKLFEMLYNCKMVAARKFASSLVSTLLSFLVFVKTSVCCMDKSRMMEINIVWMCFLLKKHLLFNCCEFPEVSSVSIPPSHPSCLGFIITFACHQWFNMPCSLHI